MTDLVKRLRARRVVHWGHGTGETPQALGTKPDAECQEAADKLEELLRWKSTHAPRIEALEGLLAAAQQEARAFAALHHEHCTLALLTEHWWMPHEPPNAEVTGLGRNRSNDER